VVSCPIRWPEELDEPLAAELLDVEEPQAARVRARAPSAAALATDRPEVMCILSLYIAAAVRGP